MKFYSSCCDELIVLKTSERGEEMPHCSKCGEPCLIRRAEEIGV